MQDGRGPCWFYTGDGCLATTGLDKTSLVLVNEAGLIHSLFVVSQAILFPTVRECIKERKKTIRISWIMHNLVIYLSTSDLHFYRD